MTSLANIINRMIDNGNTDGLTEKVDVLYLNGELTEDEYTAIMKRLKPQEPEDGEG